ncbi:type IX secretion system membrane protein PorP/SprF [Paraflavitalea soli]|uniref:Type IX secretion system membrane protein PorP/SprF n=1 Tax=Paraflavitalea soli TaxID=2315862 RepID=A0A3B7MI07_9BACT|nr:type IX secretion system membrane protein PorP/SprF [Paraflavitalea soli]AXY72943.1 type IX secretion system membrane protein PorP/SprF [Paraflavitalea soli]
MNAKFQYLDLVWMGGSYRYKDGYAGMLGLNISDAVNLGYAYDVTTSGLKTVSKGTHRLLIGFILGNKYNDRCPEKLW